jgi:predicted metal-dependent peptidase
MTMDLREHIKAKSGDQVRDALPMEHFANNSELRFFMEILLLIHMQEYIPSDPKDEFLACVGTKKDETQPDNPRKLFMALALSKLGQFSIRQQMYIIAHEAGHILLSHNVGDATRFEDPKVWNIAIDAMINSLLNKYYSSAVEMPVQDGKTIGITVESLKGDNIIETGKGVDDLTADEIYGLFDEAMKSGKKFSISMSGGKGSGSGKTPIDAKDLADALDGNRIDEHDASLDPKNLPEEVTQALDQMIYRKKSQFDRPSRRIHLQGIKTFIPRKRTEEFKIYVGIDCSGSCDNYVEGFLGYVMALPEFEQVIYCDTEVKHIVNKGENIPQFVPGLGGTDLNPMLKMFEDIEAKARNIKTNFILLTDGEIPEVTCGPRDSTMVVFTTHNFVEFAEARKQWANIQINPETCEVEEKQK